MQISIAVRLTASMVSAVALALVTASVWLLATERDELLAAVEREVRTLGGSTQVAVGHALRDAQEVDVTRLLARVDAIDPTTDLVFIGLDGTIRAASKEDASVSSALLDLAHDAALTGSELWFRSEHVLALALPVPDTQGAVLVLRRLDDVHDDLWHTLRAVITMNLLAIFLVGSISVATSVLLVRRPLRAATAAMVRVRDGDLDAVVPPGRRDEIGAITGEFNGLVAALRRARAELREAEEAQRLVEARLARADKLTTVGQLAAGLAHEIGTPLHVVAGRARSIVDNPNDPAQVARLAGILVEQTERIARIVDQLVRFARRPGLGCHSVALQEPVCAVLSLLEGEARRAGVEVVLDLRPVPPIVADADQLQQVALNLLRNAIAATPSGGRVTVTISDASTQHNAPQGAVALAVADTGAGIPPENLDHIFEPFFTTRYEEGGSGLGLSVVQSIVNSHRGQLHVASEVGVGTVMTVTFLVEGP